MTRVVMTSESNEVLARAEREFASLRHNLWTIANEGAIQLRETDHYEDRTGDLRASTQAYATERGGELYVIIEMGERYASYVNRLGFSNFDEVVKEVEAEIRHGLTAMVVRIEGRG